METQRNLKLDRRGFLTGIAAVTWTAATPGMSFGSTTGVPYELIATEIEVFPNQQPGDFTHFRVPSLASTLSGQLFAFCEGRRSRRDYGDTDILMKMSLDGGATWSSPKCTFGTEMVCPAPPAADGSEGTPHETVMGDEGLFPEAEVNWRNPTAVYAEGKLFLFLIVDEGGEEQKDIQAGQSKYRSRYMVLETLNPEADWSTVVEWSAPTEMLLSAEYLWAQTGPGRAVYNNGRLIVPAAFNNGSREDSAAFALFSDDLGRTWRQSFPAGPGTETQITALSDTTLLMSKRAKSTQEFWVSEDNGNTWTVVVQEGSRIVTPTVQTGLITDTAGRVIITAPNHPSDRVDVSVWVSDGFGPVANWSGPLPLEPDNRCTTKESCNNTQGYSCPGLLPDGTLVVLYEDSKRGEPYRRINAALLRPTA
jgi:hypothetical protein